MIPGERGGIQQREFDGKREVTQAISLRELAKCIDDQIEQGRLDELRAEVDVGLAEADRGEFSEFSAESVIAARRAALAQKQKGG